MRKNLSDRFIESVRKCIAWLEKRIGAKPRPCAKCVHGEGGAAVPYGAMCYFCCPKCWSYFEEKKEK